MAAFFLFLLTALCVLEVMLFGLFGQALGPWAVLAEVLATGWFGLSLARGKIYLLEPEHLYTEEDPLFKKRLIVEKALLIVSGVLLLMPGLVTDALGIVLLSTEVRRVLAVALTAQSSFIVVLSQSRDTYHRFRDDLSRQFWESQEARQETRGSPVIDGECREVTPKAPMKTKQRKKRRTRQLPRGPDVSGSPGSPPRGSYGDTMV